jgi:hypothetical protein
MRFVRLCAFMGACALSLPAQLTTDQKIEEFQYLTALYAKNYAHMNGKRRRRVLIFWIPAYGSTGSDRAAMTWNSST